MKISKQKGFTLIELIIAILAVAGLCFVGYLAYVLVHFINKFW